MATARRRPARRSRTWQPLLYAYCALVFAFLTAPMVVVAIVSFSSASYLVFPPPGFSLRWYARYLNDPIWIDATVRSFKVGLVATAISTVLGTLLAFSLVRGRYPGRAIIDRLSIAPLIVPSMVYSIAVYGLFASLRLIGSWPTIALAHAVHILPYVVLIVVAALKTFDVAQEQAAMGLGATRLGAILRVTLPQIRPALVSAAFLAFISSFDELVIAMFLGGAQMTLPKKMFDNIMTEIDPTIAAVSVLQIVLVAIALGLASRFGAGVKPVA
ncbi:MAG: ABC transporter permease [Candidatus Rokubacteria bacterium]|nr:ABC transporter permease [Candidatus Rokubacteria bacterium]